MTKHRIKTGEEGLPLVIKRKSAEYVERLRAIRLPSDDLLTVAGIPFVLDSLGEAVRFDAPWRAKNTRILLAETSAYKLASLFFFQNLENEVDPLSVHFQLGARGSWSGRGLVSNVRAREVPHRSSIVLLMDWSGVGALGGVCG